MSATPPPPVTCATSPTPTSCSSPQLTISRQKPDSGAVVPSQAPPKPPNQTVFYLLRDELRATLLAHGFAIHPRLYTPIATLHELYCAAHPDDARPPPAGAFRSALGRVFGGPLRKSGDMVGIAAPAIPCVDQEALRAAYRARLGAAARARAAHSPAVAEMRAARAQKRRAASQQCAGTAGASARVQELNFRYMDEFLGLKCATDLLEARLFPNAKELAESMAAFNAVRDYCMVRTDGAEAASRFFTGTGVLRMEDPSVTVVAVGDGCTPRTAALFAFRTAWRCVSIDPTLRTAAGRPWAGVGRLEELPLRVQDATVHIPADESRVVVVAWHAHVSLKDAVGCLSFGGKKWNVEDAKESRSLRERVAVFSCACCNYERLQRELPDGSPPNMTYEDTSVPGDKRTIRVWRYVDQTTELVRL